MRGLAVFLPDAREAAPTNIVDDDRSFRSPQLGYKPRDAQSALDIARKELGNEAELSALSKRHASAHAVVTTGVRDAWRYRCSRCRRHARRRTAQTKQ